MSTPIFVALCLGLGTLVPLLVLRWIGRSADRPENNEERTWKREDWVMVKGPSQEKKL